jgi:hypothetical protein
MDPPGREHFETANDPHRRKRRSILYNFSGMMAPLGKRDRLRFTRTRAEAGSGMSWSGAYLRAGPDASRCVGSGLSSDEEVDW